MLEYILQLPFEALGLSMLGFLELIDIIQFENAAASHESQHLLRGILPYRPAIVVKSDDRFELHKKSFEWFNKRRCHAKLMRINIELLCDIDITDYTLDNIELYVRSDISLQPLTSLKNHYINERVTSLNIEDDQDPTVMEVLFSILSSVRSLNIEFSNLSEWMDHIKKIGPCLRELLICDNCAQIKTITEYCPYLEKLSLSFQSVETHINILQSIASKCPHLRSLEMYGFNYNTSAEADADLTAFAEKCPQLEELSLHCEQLNDQSVLALTQHSSRLKKLSLYWSEITRSSLIALSEHGLPLEELHFIPRIPIRSAEIAAQSAHALSRIHKLNISDYEHRDADIMIYLRYAIQYMTGLRELDLNSSDDHLLVPHLLLLLQGQCCAGLESLSVGSQSSITPQQLRELVTVCTQLQKVAINKSTCNSYTVLLKLARSCPHLQKVTLHSRKLAEKSLMALATHCRQLCEIDLSYTTVTEETVRQLAQHCRRLTKLHAIVSAERRGRVTRVWCWRELRALRGTHRG